METEITNPELKVLNRALTKELEDLNFNWKIPKDYNFELININHRYSDLCPEQAFVCKWFRDIHNISICILPSNKCYYVLIQFNDVNLGLYTNGLEKVSSNKFKTFVEYEKAEETGISEAIKILKEKINGTK